MVYCLVAKSNVLMPEGTKSFPEPILTYHQIFSQVLIGDRIHEKYPWTYSVTCVRRSYFYNYNHVTWGAMVKVGEYHFVDQTSSFKMTHSLPLGHCNQVAKYLAVLYNFLINPHQKHYLADMWGVFRGFKLWCKLSISHCCDVCNVMCKYA